MTKEEGDKENISDAVTDEEAKSRGAEIIKVAEARLGKSGKVKTDLTDAAIELDRLLIWTAGAEEALKKKKLRKIGDFLKKAEKAVEEVENKLRDWQQIMDLAGKPTN